ncbi:MAG: response regulator, partial [Spirochaeta sp.]|nr:response regulator [Spirochaeta sp.]
SRQHQDIDLIVLDIIMPDMDGKKVYERLKKSTRQAVRKIYVASSTSLTLYSISVRSKGFCKKPFAPSASMV